MAAHQRARAAARTTDVLINFTAPSLVAVHRRFLRCIVVCNQRRITYQNLKVRSHRMRCVAVNCYLASVCCPYCMIWFGSLPTCTTVSAAADRHARRRGSAHAEYSVSHHGNQTISCTRPSCWIQISTVGVINSCPTTIGSLTLTGELSSRDMHGWCPPKFKLFTWSNRAPFMDGLPSVLLPSTYLPNLKSLTPLITTKIWKATENVENDVVWGS